MSKLELLDFYADWCGPCVAMKPIIQSVEQEMTDLVSFKKINVDKQADQASQYNIMSIPNYVLVKDGQSVDQRSGSITKKDLIDWIKKHADTKS